MIDPKKLLAYPIPEGRVTIRPQDVTLYALSIGFAQDPLDERELDYVDHHRSLRVVPSFAIVAASPGFWLADPATTVDAVNLVHGEQSVTLHRPLPTSGTLTGKTRITKLIDKGPGQAGLILNEKQLFDENGTLLATASGVTFLRGQGGFGGEAGSPPPLPPVPDTPPDHVVDLPTRPEQALLYRLNGDDNPLHADPAVAKRAGFPAPILHGLCTYGVACRAILATLCGFDHTRLKGMAARFTSPVYPGETIRTELWNTGAFRARIPARNVVVLDRGTADVT